MPIRAAGVHASAGAHAVSDILPELTGALCLSRQSCETGRDFDPYGSHIPVLCWVPHSKMSRRLRNLEPALSLPKGWGFSSRFRIEIFARLWVGIFTRAGCPILNFAFLRNLGWGFSSAFWFGFHFALQIERHRSANEVLQCRLINLVAFVDVDGAPDIPLQAGVE
jgi:hypothetical protein